MANRELTQLVNDEKVRIAVKRLFNGNVSQIVGEILQNAARAGAKRIAFTGSFDDSEGVGHKLSVRDDGTGVLNGLDGWHTLLSIADSSYQDKNVSMQDPLGIGLHSLFACSTVHKVVIRSQGRMIEIDTNRWWTDKAYYSTWAQRLMTNDRDDEESGFELEIECDSGFIKDTINSLTTSEASMRSYDELPARGYEGVIEITLNGEAVDTSVLSRFDHPKEILLWEDDYLGNRLKIGYGRWSAINWYGQTISSHLLDGMFSFYFEVRTGTPLDLQSPTRKGVIKNDKQETLKRFMIDRIFETVNTTPIENVKLDWVKGLYRLDSKRADTEAKYYVAGQISDASTADFSNNEEFQQVKEKIKEYNQKEVLLLWSGITIEYQESGENKQRVEQYGVETFVGDLQRIYGKPYHLICGSEKRLRLREVVWRPNQVGTSVFVEPGVFTLREEGVNSEEWHAVTGDVFTFDTTAVYDILDAKPLIAAKDRLAWLRSGCSSALFDPRDAENTYEKCLESFENSITDLIVREFPDMIAEPIFLSDLAWRMGGAKITKIFVIWPDKGRPVLKVTNENGQETELKVV